MTKICECRRPACRTAVSIHHDDYVRAGGHGRRVVSAAHHDPADLVVREFFDGRTLVVETAEQRERRTPGRINVLCSGCGARRWVGERQARRVREDAAVCQSCASRRAQSRDGWGYRPEPWKTVEENSTPAETWARFTPLQRKQIGAALKSLPTNIPIERKEAA